ncbi:MAG: Coenzyme F420 hydrogenase/dehydrogenase, beta subunit C-terminal domain [Anaerostipes sp.]|uniref:Coenzyme F420 hydrogenase/dehydrogenase, beta subunit C-terminal domain n=1 Tax=Anaerostipes sp. TaxID=1872530 RepID=UPI003993D911
MEIIAENKCTGCSACYNVCPQNAIEMNANKRGFLYPVIIKEKCIECNLCKKVCPANGLTNNNVKELKVFAAWNKNEQIRMNSTSGGVFTALAQEIIRQDGLVVGAVYGNNMQIVHNMISTQQKIKELRQSKYVQSDLKDIFKVIKDSLVKGKTVMFCGTPCQSAGLQKYLQKEYDNLYICDFVCRGIISPLVYEKYLKELESEFHAKISKIQFKNKDWGWNNFSTKIIFANKKIYQKSRAEDLYMRGYLNYNLYMRECCYQCEFKKLPRISDITLGDFWGIGEKDKLLDENKGTSVVMVNSNKGKILFARIIEKLNIHEATVEDIIKGNACLLECPERGKYQNYFYTQLKKNSFSVAMNKVIKKQNKKGITEFLSIIKYKINGE